MAATKENTAAAGPGQTVDTSGVATSPVPGTADVALAKPDDLTPASIVHPSGALQEPEISDRIDTAHPAVDDHPRAGQPIASNMIQFNDHTVPGHVQVARNLGLADDYDKPADAKA